MSLLLSDFIDPMAFFQGVHDAPELQLDANHTASRPKTRASSLGDCARTQGYQMAGTPKSNPQRDDPSKVVQQYANEQGRVNEDISIAALQNQPGRTIRLAVVSRQAEVPDHFPFTGHPDGELVWLLDGEVWDELPAEVQAQRYFFSAKLFGRDDETLYRVGLEHKSPGVNTYGRVLKNGILAERPGWLYQGTSYGKAFNWDFVLFIDIAEDHTAVRTPKMGFLKYLDHPTMAKGKFELFDLRQWGPVIYPQLERRAVALMDHMAENGDPALIKREFTGTGTFPCGYCEWQDRCNVDGPGEVVIPPAPLEV